MSATPQLEPPVSSAATTSRAREQCAPGEVRIQLDAHCSLTPKSARWFFITVSIGPTLTAAFCLARGFWPVLPFAGLELVLLAWALSRSMRRGKQQECIVITDAEVIISAQLGARPVVTRFSRHWTRVKLRAPHSTLHPSRLCLESRGRACEVGSFLTEEERAALAVRLVELVGAMSSSPSLGV